MARAERNGYAHARDSKNGGNLMILERDTVKPRPVNCPPDIGRIGDEKRCPYCRQWHLREGYRQALDPRSPNYDKAAHKTAALAGVLIGPGPAADDVTDRQKPVTVKPPVTAPVTDAVTDKPAVTATRDTPETAGEANCLECGDPFTPSRADAKYCSATCRQRARRHRAAKTVHDDA